MIWLKNVLSRNKNIYWATSLLKNVLISTIALHTWMEIGISIQTEMKERVIDNPHTH